MNKSKNKIYDTAYQISAYSKKIFRSAADNYFFPQSTHFCIPSFWDLFNNNNNKKMLKLERSLKSNGCSKIQKRF